MSTVPRRAAIYARVSTDSQDTSNQLRELEAVAQRHGWDVVGIFSDQGVSGARDRFHLAGAARSSPWGRSFVRSAKAFTTLVEQHGSPTITRQGTRRES